jgi:hypothetical protein
MTRPGIQASPTGPPSTDTSTQAGAPPGAPAADARGTENPRIDTTLPHPARRYNYWLGGKDNFAADRTSGDEVTRVFPHVAVAARENRAFLDRVVTHLVRDLGITQFLDIGTGLPTADNTHDIAQRIQPAARIVYVDNDPLVLVHARALLTGHPDGQTVYVEADLRDAAALLRDSQLRETVRWDEPVGLLLIAVLHFLTDADEPQRQLKALIDAMPAGSYLALSHATSDFFDTDTTAKLAAMAASGAHGPYRARTRVEVEALVTDLDLVEPGTVPVSQWRPDRPDDQIVPPEQTGCYGLLAKIG